MLNAETVKVDRLGLYLLGPNDTPENGIYTGDARELAKAIPDVSVDLIFTDPPYARKFEQVFYDLAEYAPRVLKPGGSLITLCGQQQVVRVGNALASDLDFRWTGWLINERKIRLPGIKILCGGKPFLWLTKPGKKVIVSGFWWDTQHAQGWTKEHHKWEQPIDYAMWNIEKVTSEGAIVFDPFAGSGGFLLAAKSLGRRYLGFEIDPNDAECARQRVAQTQLSPLAPKAGQMELLK